MEISYGCDRKHVESSSPDNGNRFFFLLSLFGINTPGIVHSMQSLWFFLLCDKGGFAGLDSSTFMCQEVQLTLLLILPTAMHLAVGGFELSSNVTTWCIMAAAGSILLRIY
jgi:hypothetical protein